MLTFEEKLAIIESFPQLTRNDVSLKRVNFHYEGSLHEKKTVVYHLHPNGNGFVYGAFLKGYRKDDKGLVNIRDFSAEELRTIIEASIEMLSHARPVAPQANAGKQELAETWIDKQNNTLQLQQEDSLWNVYHGLNLEASFESYVEAENYLKEEGFSRQ
ncbi:MULTISPECIES: hypothetical protein [Brevibacillus]|uniref:Uncharacterized protein n=2 Tax=Brevibacillus TaxID=55080 RepID=A0A1I4AKB6_9BACL|nr:MULTISPECIES: hypothetical protein [Brevibacillus]MEC2127999.1 hypothetical protein [Brevibacillus centrosporus]MED4910696.1 hypothetical protein [Brevibacillus centrosporus]RNB67628.1 hypothetical protein EDM55_19670 [Brevibacillus centrosporus]RNB86832.1 hypothetical protein EDM59_11790 [Brevibacillus nitrificans]SFK56935.1 hypothetical protein SAMN05518846_115111 [Brevibacillus centrosporus]